MALMVLAATSISVTGCIPQTLREPNSSQQESLKKFLQGYLGDPLMEKDRTTRYSSALVDLRDDGTQEVIVYITGQYWCGSGGCEMLILEPNGPSWRVITKTTITRAPIRVLVTKSNGWHDIAVLVGGGGILHAYEAMLSLNGRRYPSNPSVPPARRLIEKVPGRVVVPAEGNGKPLYQ